MERTLNNLSRDSNPIQSIILSLVSSKDFINKIGIWYPIIKRSIVLFSTVAVRKGFTNHAIISSAKGAIEGLTISLAAEFAPNIRVNCIAPSLTDSKMSKSILKSKLISDGIAKSHPMKRIGKPEDAASMAKFLLSDESPWVTGQIIGVDGGKSSLS